MPDVPPPIRLRKFADISERPVNLRVRVPLAVADYLIARSKERKGKYRTFRELSLAMMDLAFAAEPWNQWDYLKLPKSKPETPKANLRNEAEEFVQLNIFIPVAKKNQVVKMAETIGVSMSAFVFSIICWWIASEEARRQQDPEIVQILTKYWPYPANDIEVAPNRN